MPLNRNNLLLFGVALGIFACTLIYPTYTFAQSQEARIEALELLLSRMELTTVDGKASYIFGPEQCKYPDGTPIESCGVNVYIRDGSGSTLTPKDKDETGLGNLIIGYNELPSTQNPLRTATHSIIVGNKHEYLTTASIILGIQNKIQETSLSLINGHKNIEIDGVLLTILGGFNHIASQLPYSVILGGEQNTSTGRACVIAGGYLNHCKGKNSSIIGGLNNTTYGEASIIAAGLGNIISSTGLYATIIGGLENLAEAVQSSILGGYNHKIHPESNAASISGGKENIILKELGQNERTGWTSSISGGRHGEINGDFGSITGGKTNQVQSSAIHTVQLSGSQGKIYGKSGVVLGGFISGLEGSDYGIILGGRENTATGIYASIVGGNSNISESEAGSVLGGGEEYYGNIATGALGSVVIGGRNNNSAGNYCTLSGGNNRTSSQDYSYP